MQNYTDLASQLAECGREFYRRSWVLGTSGNFSALEARDPLRVCITASGNDKGALAAETHFLEIDDSAAVLSGVGKPSAETSLHLAIYKLKPNAGAILHTHSVWGTILSDVHFREGGIEIEGYEMLKGLAGVATHEHREFLPIVENSQNYNELSRTIEQTLLENPAAHGVYLRRHGLYTWGKDVAEAKRHIEIYEFLFEVLGRSIK
ncbi:MAG TPA: methylthioribulose 1-phosphate dehydratase [Pyrinomonadaceae bacterium]|nr:methylthioribulose 1-phosphate dehydratase [Pyrinomonadaceae bacterium]